MIVDDIQSHSYWASYKNIANKAGLKACWSEPIRSTKGQVLGTFAFYYHEARKPTEATIALIEQASDLVKIAIEKNRTKLILQSSEERYALAMQATQDGLWDWNILTGEVVYAERWKNILGYKHNEIKNEFSEWQQRLHPDDLATTTLNLEEFLRNNSKTIEQSLG